MIIYQTENVTVFQSAMFQLNSTVVLTADAVIVVDPGYLPMEIEKIRDHVDRRKGNRPVYLFFTHSDFDHIVGYGAFPDATTIASTSFVTSELKENQLADAVKYDHEFYIQRPYPLEYPTVTIMVEKNGEQLNLKDTVLTFYQANGHNHDGLLLYIASQKVAIVGDYLSDIEFPFIYYSFQAYKETLATLKDLFATNKGLTLITSHGSVTKDKEEIEKRIKDSEEYLELMKHMDNEEQFNQYLKEKDYRFTTIFKKRHEDNLTVFNKEMKS